MSIIEVSGNPTTNNDTLVVNFTTDAPNIESISLSKDGGETYISATSFTNTSASFDVSDWSNGTYTNCMLRCVYTEEEIILTNGSKIYTANVTVTLDSAKVGKLTSNGFEELSNSAFVGDDYYVVIGDENKPVSTVTTSTIDGTEITITRTSTIIS